MPRARPGQSLGTVSCQGYSKKQERKRTKHNLHLMLLLHMPWVLPLSRRNTYPWAKKCNAKLAQRIATMDLLRSVAGAGQEVSLWNNHRTLCTRTDVLNPRQRGRPTTLWSATCRLEIHAVIGCDGSPDTGRRALTTVIEWMVELSTSICVSGYPDICRGS